MHPGEMLAVRAAASIADSLQQIPAMRPSDSRLQVLLTAHPHSVGETYWQHAGFALRAGLLLIGAGLAAMVHAILPFAFVRHASRVVFTLHAEIVSRAPDAARPRR